ncbi:MAG: DUF3768 domain-containing protein [Methylocystis sp.]
MRDRIREFDDAFRSSFDRSKGLPVSTAGVCSLLRDVRAIATREVATFAEFVEDNDPPGEHKSGASALFAPSAFPKFAFFLTTMRNRRIEPMPCVSFRGSFSKGLHHA